MTHLDNDNDNDTPGVKQYCQWSLLINCSNGVNASNLLVPSGDAHLKKKKRENVGIFQVGDLVSFQIKWDLGGPLPPMSR